MKYIKLFMLLFAMSAFVACSDDDNDVNTNECTVSMQSTTVTVKENAGIFNVPIEVTGEMNGKVKVTIAVSGTGDNPATEDVHYYVTDKTITLSESTGNVEIETVDDDEVNVDRTFTVTIIEAEGAQIGNASTTVTLRDNDSQYYDKLTGTWTMTAFADDDVDYDDDATPSYTWTVNITGAEEGESDYEKYLNITGMMGYSWTQATLAYNYDQTTQSGYVEMQMGELFAEEVNFSGLGTMNVYLLSLSGNNLTSTPLRGTWSEDFKTITFEEYPAVYGALFDASTNEYSGYVWFGIRRIVMTKK